MTKPAAIRTSVAVLTADHAFEQSLRATFGASGQIDLRVVSGSISTVAEFAIEGATVVIVDLDTSRGDEMQALERMMQRTGGGPPVVVVAQSFEADVARSLLQMRVADFLVKPVQPLELVRTCARVARTSATETTEAQIYSFIPSVGGAGVTTLAIQTALLLLNSGQRVRPTTCSAMARKAYDAAAGAPTGGVPLVRRRQASAASSGSSAAPGRSNPMRGRGSCSRRTAA